MRVITPEASILRVLNDPTLEEYKSMPWVPRMNATGMKRALDEMLPRSAQITLSTITRELDRLKVYKLATTEIVRSGKGGRPAIYYTLTEAGRKRAEQCEREALAFYGKPCGVPDGPAGLLYCGSCDNCQRLLEIER